MQTSLPFNSLLDHTDMKNQINVHNQTSALADQQVTGHLQEQVSALEDEKVQC